LQASLVSGVTVAVPVPTTCRALRPFILALAPPCADKWPHISSSFGQIDLSGAFILQTTWSPQ